jgi:hypothetical protein
VRFKVKEVLLHGARKVSIYCAECVPSQLRFIDPVEYTRVILANSEGFKYIRDVFIVAAANEIKDSIFYIEDNSMLHGEYEEWWKIGRFHLDMVIFNYHSIQLDAKEIARAINLSRNVAGISKEITIPDIKMENKNHWLINKKLCTKSYKDKFIVSGNRDVLLQLAYDAEGFVNVEDDEEYNMGYHTHEDMIGTKEYNGMDFFYYHQK